MKHSHLQSSCFCHPSRRGFLTGLAGLAAGATVVQNTTYAQNIASAVKDRIDTHHHVFSPAYVEDLVKVNQAPPIIKNWSLNKTMDDMEKAGVKTSILSVTQPQVTFADAANAKRICRESNEWVAKLHGQYPGRFGSFAMLPMQDIDASLKELEYALDVLKADGIGLLTNYGDKWLGHPKFAPIMDELNRRKAILYTHPAAADCCLNTLPEIPATVIEFGADTTRTITDIIFSGTANRCPDVKFIFSHAGGVLPFLVERMVWVPKLNPKMNERVPRGVLHELKRFYYDTAWSAHAGALASLTKLVDVPQILFGSDYPYRTGEDNVKGLADYGFSASDLQAIGKGNAQRILSRWKA